MRQNLGANGFRAEIVVLRPEVVRGYAERAKTVDNQARASLCLHKRAARRLLCGGSAEPSAVQSTKDFKSLHRKEYRIKNE